MNKIIQMKELTNSIHGVTTFDKHSLGQGIGEIRSNKNSCTDNNEIFEAKTNCACFLTGMMIGQIARDKTLLLYCVQRLKSGTLI